MERSIGMILGENYMLLTEGTHENDDQDDIFWNGIVNNIRVAWPKNVVTWPNLKISLCKICYPPGKFFLNKLNSYPKIQIFTVGIFQILKNKASRSIFWISAIKKTEKIWHFCDFFHFYPTLDYHKIRTRTNFENPNGKNLDLHLIMWYTLK